MCVDSKCTRLFASDNHGYIYHWNINGYAVDGKEPEPPERMNSFIFVFFKFVSVNFNFNLILSGEMLESSCSKYNCHRLHRVGSSGHIELGRLHDTRLDTGRPLHWHVRPRRSVELVRREELQASACAIRHSSGSAELARASHTEQARDDAGRAGDNEAVRQERTRGLFALIHHHLLFVIKIFEKFILIQRDSPR